MINFGDELRAAIDSIDPRLHEFFETVVNSFIRLEIVVLMRRNPDLHQSPADISRELGWPEDRVAEEFDYLEKTGIIQQCTGRDVLYRVSTDPQVADLLNKFGFLYANRSSRLLILGHLLREGRQTLH